MQCTEDTLIPEVQRTHSLGRTQGNSTLEKSRAQARWEEQERLERDMGVTDIPRRGEEGHRKSNSRGGEGSNYTKKSQVLVSPTHQPLQLLTAELAQKDISPGHSQFFQPAGNWTQPTDQKGAIGLGVTGGS